MKSANKWVGLLLFLIPTSACQNRVAGSPVHKLDTGGGGDFDVNDVSVLFPLPPPKQAQSLLLGLDAQGKGGVLLSPSHFDQMVTAHQVQIPYAQWRVVSFRFDTCGVDSAQPGVCLAQLRLEVMPLESSNQTSDQALHLIYNLAPADVDNVISDLHGLKTSSPAATSGVALGIHPGLAAAGLDSDYARSVEAFLLRYLGEPNLIRVAALLLDPNSSFHAVNWIFTASSVDSSGTLTPLAIPGTTSSLMTLTATSDPSPPPPPGGIPAPGLPRTVLTPAPSGTDHLDILLSVADTQNASATNLQTAVDVALRLANPPLHNPFDVDCASCHMASRQLTVASGLRQITTDGNPNKFVLPAGVTGTFTSPDGPPNIQLPGYFTKAFAYAGNMPSFIERTVNESAAIAALLNASN
jgi:hypothetical protein